MVEAPATVRLRDLPRRAARGTGAPTVAAMGRARRRGRTGLGPVERHAECRPCPDKKAVGRRRGSGDGEGRGLRGGLEAGAFALSSLLLWACLLVLRPFAPPSVLPDISPSRGE